MHALLRTIHPRRSRGAEERPTIERVDNFVEERGARMRGKHHEIYLTDPSRTAPKENNTVIRHPF